MHAVRFSNPYLATQSCSREHSADVTTLAILVAFTPSSERQMVTTMAFWCLFQQFACLTAVMHAVCLNYAHWHSMHLICWLYSGCSLLASAMRLNLIVLALAMNFFTTSVESCMTWRCFQCMVYKRLSTKYRKWWSYWLFNAEWRAVSCGPGDVLFRLCLTAQPVPKQTGLKCSTKPCCAFWRQPHVQWMPATFSVRTLAVRTIFMYGQCNWDLSLRSDWIGVLE